jgi:glycosyltransferase involved in cell wall biosynthesis
MLKEKIRRLYMKESISLKKNKCRLSVIIPGHNNPFKWWERSIKSVLLACSINDEIICVDDGSDIPVSEFWDEITKGVLNIRLVSLPAQKGLSQARNAGLLVSQGEYVTFVDSDDEILPNTFNVVFDEIYKSRADVTFYGVRVIWPYLKLEKNDVLSTRFYGALSQEELNVIYRSCLFEYACNKIYKMSFLKKNGITFDPNVCPGEDTLFNLKCVAHNASFASVGFVGYLYYRTGKTICSCYVPSFNENMDVRRMEWEKIVLMMGEKGEVLKHKFVFTEKERALLEWDNMWRCMSPISVKNRWLFLKTHANLFDVSIRMMFLKKIIYSILRRCFYGTIFQAWKVRRTYPHCEVSK